MFNLNGVFTQYDDPANVIDPQILAVAAAAKLGPYEAVLWNRTQAPETAIVNDSFKIFDRTDSELAGSVGTSAWAENATTALPIDDQAAKSLAVGSVIKIESEIVVVKSIDRSAKTISVFSRGHGTTTAAAHAANTAFVVIGLAINDTDAHNVESKSESTVEWENYCQLIFEPIEWAFSSETEARKAYETQPVLFAEALNRVFRTLARSTILGVAQKGSAATPATTAGVLAQLTDTSSRSPIVVSQTNTALSEGTLKEAVEEVIKKGNPDTIYTSFKNKKIIDAFPHAVSDVVVAAGNETLQSRGVGGFAKYFEHGGRRLEIVVDQNMPDSEVAIVNQDSLRKGFKLNDALRIALEPPQSSRTFRSSIQGKFGVSVTDVGRDHAVITDIASA